MLQVVVTVLTNTNRRRDLQTFDLRLEATALLAEELPAVPAVVASLGQGEANGAAGAAVHHLVLHPVIGRRPAGLIADRPAEHPTTTVAHQDLTVVLGDGEGGDLSWVSVVLAIKRRVHGEFAPEDQLALPSVAGPELVVRPGLHGARVERLRHRGLSWVNRVGVRAFSLALGVVYEHESVLLVDAEGVRPAVGVVRAAVHRPGSSGPSRRTSGSVDGAARLAASTC